MPFYKKYLLIYFKTKLKCFSAINIKNFTASQKLELNGEILVLEDGTPVGSDLLQFLEAGTILLLLQQNEVWTDPDQQSGTSTISVTSGLSAISEDESKVILINNEYLWSTMEIGWDRLPHEMTASLEQNLKSKLIVKDFVQFVVNDVRKINNYIPNKVFARLANEAMMKYPSIFKDVDDDNCTLGDGHMSLTQKMIDRNNYLNRPHKRKYGPPVLPNPIKKKTINLRAGCSNWAPSPEEDVLDVEALIANAKTVEPTAADDYISKLRKTFPQQRQFINCSSVAESKNEWPSLFHKSGMFQHFSQLTGVDINKLDEVFMEKSTKIMKFYEKKFKKSIPPTGNPKEVFDYILHIFNEVTIIFDNIEAITLAPCLMTSKFFIISKDWLRTPNNLYFIFVAVPNGRYAVYAEKILIMEETSFLEALKILFCSYFNFNMKYPINCSSTLEFIQRYMLKIHPDRGSRSSKITYSKRKVINLMTKLNDIQ